MRSLGPDDYTVGKVVTVTAGPFRATESPFPPGMFGQSEPPKQEDKSLHGRVFRIIVFDPPFLLLEPLDGIGEAPHVQQVGSYAMIPYGGKFSPSAIKLNTKTGIVLSEVSTEYALAYQKYFCPPTQMRQQPQEPPGPIRRLLEGSSDDCDCDTCPKSGSCPNEDETRKSR